jgi:serine/threonine protein kinase
MASEVVTSESVARRYRIQRPLGEGTTKRVYLARDTVLDRDVALSILKTDGLDGAGLARLRTEAQAIARLGTHPHVVTVFDLGDAAGGLYLSTEFVAGGELQRRLDAAPEHRLPLDEALRLADEICQALAHAHAADLVHRDLNPGNVWLTAEGAAKVGDFGLAVSIARSRAVREGRLVTAVAYLAPEVALGRAPDPRSDLYSLGAMLYEMTAGRPPFLGDDALAVLAQHIHTPPVSPACHRVDLPAALEALILRLLAKVPGDRPPSAVAVRELLAAIVPGVPAGSSHRRNPLDELASGAFVGREGVLDVLRTAAEEAMAGRGCTVLLAGEAGIGKTRTAQAIATYARLREMAVVVGRCHEGEGAPAYWPWAQLLRQIDEPPGPEVAPLLAAPSTSPPEPSEARFRLLDGVARHLAAPRAHDRSSSCSTISIGPTAPRRCCSATWPARSPTCRSCWSERTARPSWRRATPSQASSERSRR